MPAKPQWFPILPQVIDALEEMEAPVVDRACIERLFRVSRRWAIRLLHRFGGFQAGRTFLVDRRDLVRQLEAIRHGEVFFKEAKRRERVLHELDEVSRLQRARAVKFKVARREAESSGGLPQGVTVEPGRIVVEFETMEELLGRLFRLSQSAARDFPAFERSVLALSRTE